MAPCHAVDAMTFRILHDFMTREEAIEFASRFEVTDSNPDETGAYKTRPAILADRFPQPYANSAAAKFANNGAAPPNLQSIVFGRHHGTDYVFHLMTGYSKPPCHGRPTPEGVWWNPYMAGGFIAMPPPLSDGMIEYNDGTPCTTYQMSKDVVSFLQYCAFVQRDWYKLLYWKFLTVCACTGFFAFSFANLWEVKTKYAHRWWQPILRNVKLPLP